MQQIDVNTDEAFRSFLPGQQQEDDRALVVEFFTDKKLLGAKSQAEKRPIYEDREYVRIQIKGQDKQLVVHEVTHEHRTKYPIAYQRFVLQKPAPVIGTPIEQLPGVGPSMAHHLKGLALRTVEDVANISDENTLQRVGMGARDLVNRAKAWLAQTTESTVSLQAKLAEKSRENEELRGIVGEMNERIKALEKSPKKAKKNRKARAAPQPQAPE